MANNRLMLKCRRCNNEFALARFSAGADVWSSSRVLWPEDFDHWLDTHTRCITADTRLSDPFGLDVELTAENPRLLVMHDGGPKVV